jgi:hypothetical protein
LPSQVLLGFGCWAVVCCIAVRPCEQLCSKQRISTTTSLEASTQLPILTPAAAHYSQGIAAYFCCCCWLSGRCSLRSLAQPAHGLPYNLTYLAFCLGGAPCQDAPSRCQSPAGKKQASREATQSAVGRCALLIVILSLCTNFRMDCLYHPHVSVSQCTSLHHSF